MWRMGGHVVTEVVIFVWLRLSTMRDHVKSFTILYFQNKLCLLLFAEKKKYVGFHDEGLISYVKIGEQLKAVVCWLASWLVTFTWKGQAGNDVSRPIHLKSCCLFWVNVIVFFSFSVLYLMRCVIEGSMAESSLLSKDELLTPNIDGIIALWVFRKRAQNTKIGENWIFHL